MPRRNSWYWLGAGALAAVAVHPIDDNVHDHFLETGGGNQAFWKPVNHRVHAAGDRWLPRDLRHRAREEHATRAASRDGRARVGRSSLKVSSPWRSRSAAELAASAGRNARLRLFLPLRACDRHVRGGNRPSTTPRIQSGHPDGIVATYVAASRLHDNVHWTSDVVMGAALGVMIGRTVTWHGRNFYASPMLLPHGGTGIAITLPTS